MKNLFEKATRGNLRFTTSRGLVTTEDLWDLNLPTLDTVAQGLHKRVSAGKTTSFIDAEDTSAEHRLAKLQFETVKRVIEVKMADKRAAEKAVLTKAKKQKLLGVLQHKQDEALGELSEAEIQKLINEL